MAVAMICPEPAKGGRGKTVTKIVSVSVEYLKQARTVLRVLPELAALVLKGDENRNASSAR
jgi:hypothetical protein